MGYAFYSSLLYFFSCVVVYIVRYVLVVKDE